MYYVHYVHSAISWSLRTQSVLWLIKVCRLATCIICSTSYIGMFWQCVFYQRFFFAVSDAVFKYVLKEIVSVVKACFLEHTYMLYQTLLLESPALT